MEINLKKTTKSLVNINKVFYRRNDAIKFVDDYSSMILEAKRKAAKEEPETKPSKAKTKSPLELREEFINEIKNDEKHINDQIFKKIFFYHTPLFLAKDLYNSNQIRNDGILKHQ